MIVVNCLLLRGQAGYKSQLRNLSTIYVSPHSPNLRPKGQILAEGKEEQASAFSPTLQIFPGRVSLNA